MSSSASASITAWNYRETGSPPVLSPIEEEGGAANPAPPPGLPEEEVVRRVETALRQAQAKWDASLLELNIARNQKLAQSLAEFLSQRDQYFRDVEGEIVHLTLAIARKILRREASIDPALLCGLVRIALDDVSAEGSICLRLPPGDLHAWTLSQCDNPSSVSIKVVEDPRLNTGDVVLETHAGTANIGFEAQLKQVEQGFLDLLAHRPERS